ncbi:MAG: DNA repair and recombination protein RadA [Candidatus Lokiarchaeota archaeon]|nr:DNA repair and recombination protein RadA [Candidatus Lokiarchaeota archaeon]
MAEKKAPTNGEDENSISNPKYELDDLPGVGEVTLKKLKTSGIISIRLLAMYPLSRLMEDAGIGEKTAKKLIKAAQDIEQMGFKSADVIWEKRKVMRRISTGGQNLDDLLGGGLETGAVTEVFGEYRTGKTQLAHQLCVNVQRSYEDGGLEGCALYIDTEGTFRPERIIQMASAKDIDYKQALQNIVVGRAYNSDHQILLIKEASKIIEEKNIKLVIVDSLIGHFRSEYIGRGTLATRQQILNTHIHDLLRISEMYDEMAVFFTNQVSSKPDVFYGNPITATGGNIVAHGATIRIYLRKGKGEQRVAKIIDAPNLPESDAIFSITEDGIID